jgi:hypothetical protein
MGRTLYRECSSKDVLNPMKTMVISSISDLEIRPKDLFTQKTLKKKFLLATLSVYLSKKLLRMEAKSLNVFILRL